MLQPAFSHASSYRSSSMRVGAHHIAILFAIALFFVNCNDSLTNSNDSSHKKNISQLSERDVLVLNDAYQNILAGIKVAEEALTRSTSAEAMLLAKQINEDHRHALEAMDKLGASKTLHFPLDINEKQLADWKSIVKERGRNFDKKFIEVVLKQHKEAVVIFSAMATIQDAEVQKLSASMISLAQNHINLASSNGKVVADFVSRDTSLYKQSKHK